MYSSFRTEPKHMIKNKPEPTASRYNYTEGHTQKSCSWGFNEHHSPHIIHPIPYNGG
jgi:hypothetical protein